MGTPYAGLLAGAGASQGFEQLLARRLEAEKFQEIKRQAAVSEAHQQRQFDEQVRQRQDQAASRECEVQQAQVAKAAGLEETTRKNKEAETLKRVSMAMAQPVGTQLSSAGAKAQTDAGVNPNLYSYHPANLGSEGLVKNDVPGPWKMVTYPATPEQYTYTGTEAQQEKRREADQRSEDLRLNRENQITLRDMANAGRTAPTVVIHTTDESGKPVTKIVPKTAGSTFAAPTSATLESRLASAEAVNQTGQDIINQLRDPKVASKVGPLMGRAGRLRDFIGNPPPEFAGLAGQIESYSLANMGVHGMRSAQGSQLIAKLLDQRHTPESLIATVEGLNNFSRHFMENEGRSKRLPPAPGGRIAVVGPNGESGSVPAGTPLPDGWRAK